MGRGGANAGEIGGFQTSVEAFYNDWGKGSRASIWTHSKTSESSPDFDGNIGDQRVIGRFQRRQGGAYVVFHKELAPDVVAGPRDRQPIAVGALFLTKGKVPMLQIDLGREVIRTAISKKIPPHMMVILGIDPDDLAVERQQHLARQAQAEIKTLEGSSKRSPGNGKP